MIWPIEGPGRAARSRWATWTLAGLTLFGLAFANAFPSHLGWLALNRRDGIHHFFTCAFVHQPGWLGLAHAVLALYFLWLVGPAIEARIGHFSLLLLFLISASAGALSHQVLQSIPGRALLGLLPGVTGLMAAAIFLYPQSALRSFVFGRVMYVPILVWIALFWGFDSAISLMGLWIRQAEDPGLISWSARLSAGAIGYMVAALLWSHTRSDSNSKTEPPPQTRRRRLLRRASVAPLADYSAELQYLHECVVMNFEEEAARVFEKLTRADESACLAANVQSLLFEMLDRVGERALANVALERLLLKYPKSLEAQTARWKLANRIAQPERRRELLIEFLSSSPPRELAGEAQHMLRRLEKMRTRPSAGTPVGVSKPAPPAQSKVQGEPEPEREPDRIEEAAPPESENGELSEGDIFGDIDDSGVVVPPKFIEPPRHVEIHRSTAEADSKISFDDSKWEKTAASPGVPSGYENPNPSFILPACERHFRVPAEEPGSDFNEEPQAKHDAEAQPARSHDETGVPTGRSEQPVDSEGNAPAAAAPDESDWYAEPPESMLATSTDADTQTWRARFGSNFTPRTDWLYSVILAPAQPVDLAMVTAIFGPIFNLGPQSTQHAIVRRRGILLADIPLNEADLLAGELARFGQSVCLVGQDPDRVNFGRPLDVWSVRDLGDRVRFQTDSGARTWKWSHGLLLSGGWVALSPVAPPRAVLDLFFIRPNLHLRIWENTYRFDADQRELPGRFRNLAERLRDKMGLSILTHQLTEWLESASHHPLRETRHWIGHDNYLRWYILAHYAPSKFYPGEKA